MIPVVQSISSSVGIAAGGEFVRLTGTGFAPRVRVLFGEVPARVHSVRTQGQVGVIDLQTPAHLLGKVTVTVHNVDGVDEGAVGALPTVFRFERALLARESDVTRLVRVLLRLLKAQVLENTTTPVSVDYRTQTSLAVPVEMLPSLTLLGPDVRENRAYASNEPVERVVAGAGGPEIERCRPAVAVDLHFALTAVTNVTTEHVNLLVALTNFFHRNPYVWIERNAAVPAAGAVRFELAADGELRSSLEGKDDIRAFTWGLIVRGFPIDGYVVTGRAREVTGIDVRATRAGEPR